MNRGGMVLLRAAPRHSISVWGNESSEHLSFRHKEHTILALEQENERRIRDVIKDAGAAVAALASKDAGGQLYDTALSSQQRLESISFRAVCARVLPPSSIFSRKVLMTAFSSNPRMSFRSRGSQLPKSIEAHLPL
eukprot:5909507-Amphidinium_carterae.1